MEKVVENQLDSKNFLLELCRYYMEFLETDFRQKRAPKRRTDLKNSNALLVSIPLNTYTGLNQGAIKLLSSLLEQNKFAKVTPGQHAITFSAETVEEVASKIEGKISKNNAEETRSAIIKVATKAIGKLGVPDAERALEDLNDLIEARELFSPTSTKQKIVSFFKEYIVADFYRDIYELWKNKSILDKQDFYIYFFTVSAEDVTYPLFYLPVSVQQTIDGAFSIEPDARLLVHRKALEYLAQRTKDDNQKINLPPRHIYINEEKEGLVGVIIRTLNEVTDFFGIERVAFDGKVVEEIKGSKIAISNNCHLAIFDKSDEALLNDYEELIDLALKGGEDIFDIFKKLSEEFILDEPVNSNIEITDEYEQTSLGGKLSYQSPIPLNQEQVQILSALDKEHVKRIIVEGPPGTGKSHTIAAIIYNALLKGKSVLVVSDKKEALDVVEDKISQVLEKTRVSDDFVQNPILRLENRNNNFNKIFKPLNFKKIEDRYIAERRTSEKLNAEIDGVLNKITSSTQREVDTLSSVDFEKVKYLVQVEEEIKEQWEGLVDLQELEDAEGGGDTLKKIFEVTTAYCERASELGKNSAYLHGGARMSSELVSTTKGLVASITTIEELVKTFDDNGLKTVIDIVLRYPEISVSSEKLLSAENAFNRVSDALEGYALPLRRVTKSNFHLPLRSNQWVAFLQELDKVSGVIDKLQTYYRQCIPQGHPLLFKDINEGKVKALEDWLQSVEGLRKPLVGFLFQGDALKRLGLQFRTAFPLAGLAEPHKHVDALRRELDCFKLARELSAELNDCVYIEPGILSAEKLEVLLTDAAFTICKTIKNELEPLIDDYLIKLSKLQEEKSYDAAASIMVADVSDFRVFLAFTRCVEFVRLLRDVNRLCEGQRINLLENSEYSGAIRAEQLLKPEAIHTAKARAREMCDLFAFLGELENDRVAMCRMEDSLPHTFKKLAISSEDVTSFTATKLLAVPKERIEGLANYLNYKKDVSGKFTSLNLSNFRDVREALENRLVAKMTYILDEKVVQYANSHQNTYRQLAKIIREKRKIPKEDLGDLVRAFPCLIIGIRDLGDYLPLEAGIFDVVIIDEASQVSIAQAFPAIMRGKKVVVFGDEKQFSNVKTSTADKEINNASFNKVKEAYNDAIKSLSAGKIEKIKGVSERFNIRSSILDFLKNLANYHCSLKKHFRGYQEIMSFSNHTFYNGSLQIMKLRARPISEVIKFDIIKADPREEPYKNSNQDEATYILNQLNELKESGQKVSVGIITPFANQQKLISNMVFESENADYFKHAFNIKVMTFDTAQGEERDIIFYSMVEKTDQNILRYIFPVSLKNLDDEEEGNLKSQRLNVGLSRAKETVHFVLSKNIEDIKGEIGNALRHFKHQLEDAKKLPALSSTESEMEKLLLNYLQQTAFFRENSENIEIIPQFEIGKYLKQISKADIPSYRVDFLMIYRGGKKEKVIIIEYDGFEFHFKHDEERVNELNYDRYYVEQDVERQRILESYGYDFLRVNKFILRDNPIGELDKRLSQLLKKKL